MRVRVRRHVKRPVGRWPYAVRQHTRLRWVVAPRFHGDPFDEVVGSEELPKEDIPRGRIEEMDPALFFLTGETKSDRKQMADFLRTDLEGESTRRYAARLRKGLPMDPPVVVFDETGHEEYSNGAHRSAAALHAGVRKMPIEFFKVRGSGTKGTDYAPAPKEWVDRWVRRNREKIVRRHAKARIGLRL